MAILNPKEEQLIGEDDDTQYQARRTLGEGDIRDDVYYPKKKADAEAFLRSYANKTSGIKDGTSRNVVVFTANDVYFVTATGYLKGDIENVLPISGNEKTISELIEEFAYGTDENAKALEQWAEIVQSGNERVLRNNVSSQIGSTAVGTDEVDGGQSDGDALGYSWENYGYTSFEELIEAVESGAMVMDDNGNPIQFQQRTSPLTNQEVLSIVADSLNLKDLTNGEKTALDIFKKRLDTLRELEDKRIAEGRTYKEQQFGSNVDREAAKKTLEIFWPTVLFAVGLNLLYSLLFSDVIAYSHCILD